MKSPNAAARRFFDFLGLPLPPKIEVIQAKNVGFVYKLIGKRLHKLGLMELASRLLPDAVKTWLAPIVSRGIPPMIQEEQKELARHFQPLNHQLNAVTGFDTLDWPKNTK